MSADWLDDADAIYAIESLPTANSSQRMNGLATSIGVLFNASQRSVRTHADNFARVIVLCTSFLTDGLVAGISPLAAMYLFNVTIPG